MLTAEETEAEYYRRLHQQMHEQSARKFVDPDRDVDLERVWVAYVWVANKDNPAVGEWILGGFRRRRNRRKPQTMNRFFAKVRRKLGIDKKAPVMVCDLDNAIRRLQNPDQSWLHRPPQFQPRKRKVVVKRPTLDRTKRKTRAKQKAYIFNPKTTKYIALGRNSWDQRKPGYLYLGPLKSQAKRQAQHEAKRLFRIWDDLLVVATKELSKSLSATLKRNSRVRAGVTRLQWPEVPPTFDDVWNKFVKRLVKQEFHGAIAVDDPGLLDTRDELLATWQKEGSPWLTTKWFHKQIESWSGQCEKIDVTKLLPPKSGKQKKASGRARTKSSLKKSSGRSKKSVKRVTAIAKRIPSHGTSSRRSRRGSSRKVRATAKPLHVVRATLVLRRS